MSHQKLIVFLKSPRAGGVKTRLARTLGADAAGRLLVVVYRYREPDVTRLISAWKANKTQRTQYESNRR